MIKTKFEVYKQGVLPKKDKIRIWPLFGAGMENLGQDGQMIELPMPEYGSDELLVRHDACGLCFSDIKVIRLGQEHPRIYRDMQKEPIVLGHEVVMTVVGVGEKLRDQYKKGDKFILQADIYVDGVGYAYGYEIQGGLSEYNIIDQRILNGDHGNYLIPVKPDTCYAESALVEPWACVIAAYYLKYRTSLKVSGTAWFIGPEPERDFSLNEGFNKMSHPDVIKLTEMDGSFGSWLRKRAAELGIEVIEQTTMPDLEKLTAEEMADDIILLDPSPELIETVSPYLAFHGIMVLATDQKLSRNVQVDVGRIHYNRWLYIGGENADISKIYSRKLTRSSLKKGGRAFFVGAGGPMGRMHVQHAIETENRPSTIVCTDVSDERLADLSASYGEEAQQKGIEWICVNPIKKDVYVRQMSSFKREGFDDVVVLAPIPAVISDSAKWLTKSGVMNVFAGVARGTTAEIDLNKVIFHDTRIIGHSASSIEDMITMLNEVESGGLSTNRSVAAIGSLEAVPDGLRALQDAEFPGKVVIYPNIKPLPLTGLPDLKNVLPKVYAKLKKGFEWTKEAEQELLNEMLMMDGDDK